MSTRSKQEIIKALNAIFPSLLFSLSFSLRVCFARRDSGSPMSNTLDLFPDQKPTWDIDLIVWGPAFKLDGTNRGGANKRLGSRAGGLCFYVTVKSYTATPKS